jgi:hypothetical protein
MIAPRLYGRAVAQCIAVLCGIIVLLALVPTVAIPWLDIGRSGIALEHARVDTVAPGSPAEKAGIRRGDYVIHSSPDRVVNPAGTLVTLQVARGGRVFPVRLLLEPHIPWKPVSSAIHTALVSITSIAILMTFALLVRRPSWATGLLAVASLNLIIENQPAMFWGMFLPFETTHTLQNIVDLFTLLLPVWFLVLFALAFPRAMWSRSRALLAIPVIAAVALLQFDFIPLWVVNAAVIAPFGFAIAIFAFSYTRAEPSDQRRLTWLMVAIAVYLMFQLMIAIMAAVNFFPTPHSELTVVLDGLSALAWLPIVYAVWQRHVVGLAFAVNRGIVVAIVTATMLGMVSLARWLGEHVLVQSGIAGYLAVAVTVLFGYGLNTFAHRLQTTIERFIFRNRYAAERRVLQTIAALPFATSRETVAHAAIDEACDELRLASGALFLADDTSYTRIRDVNWAGTAVTVLDRDDRLARVLHAENKMMLLRDVAWRRDDLPSGEAEPVYAFPLTWRGQLRGLAIYGRHRDGSDLDPQELALLQRLVDAATVTYETAELGELRRRVALLERQLLSALPG